MKNRTCIIKSNRCWSIYLLSVLVMLPLYHFLSDSEKMFVCYIKSWGHRLLKFLFCGSEIRKFGNHCIGGYETLNLSKILMFILLLISKQYRVNRFPKLSTTSWWHLLTTNMDLLLIFMFKVPHLEFLNYCFNASSQLGVRIHTASQVVAKVRFG